MDHLADKPPYSLIEIEDYLFRCHSHLMLKEEPTTFAISSPHAHRHDEGRKYWVFEGVTRPSSDSGSFSLGRERAHSDHPK
jgi:hypothetical protein